MLNIISLKYEDSYEVRKDGHLLFRGSMPECVDYMHSHTSTSIDHAIKYEGYTITKSGTDWRDSYHWYSPDMNEPIT
jgi:hypothetical protein